MKILSDQNVIVDTDVITATVYYSVLSFRDYKNPDFFMEELPYLDEIQAPSMALQIGPYSLVMPYNWNILVTDLTVLECVPLSEAIGKSFSVYCLNPIDGFLSKIYTLKTGMIYNNTTWTAPPIADKDMLVVPLGHESRKRLDRKGNPVEVGPVCAIFSPTKIEVNKPISDILD